MQKRLWYTEQEFESQCFQNRRADAIINCHTLACHSCEPPPKCTLHASTAFLTLEQNVYLITNTRLNCYQYHDIYILWVFGEKSNRLSFVRRVPVNLAYYKLRSRVERRMFGCRKTSILTGAKGRLRGPDLAWVTTGLDSLSVLSVWSHKTLKQVVNIYTEYNIWNLLIWNSICIVGNVSFSVCVVLCVLFVYCVLL
jgi:hypothetical protein